MYDNHDVLDHLYRKSGVPTPRPPMYNANPFGRSTTGTAPMLATTYSLGDLGIE